jgi:flagellar protein FlgJ
MDNAISLLPLQSRLDILRSGFTEGATGSDTSLETVRGANNEPSRNRFQDFLEKAQTAQRDLEEISDDARGKSQPGMSPSEKKKLLEASYGMEALFIGTMLDVMRKTVHETGLMGKSFAKDLFNDMLYDEYAKMMAKSDQIGLARRIIDQIRG